MKKTKITAKKKNSEDKKRQRILQGAVFLVVFAVIGSVIVFARAATRVSDQLSRSSNLAIGYSGGGIAVSERDSDSQISSVTRPRAIDVSKDNRLFCTPTDNGNVTTRDLTAGEITSLQQNIYLAAANVPTEDLSLTISDQASIFVNGTIPSASNTFTAQSSPDFFGSAVSLLEGLCSQPGATPINEDEVFKLSGVREKTSVDIGDKVSDLILPKAVAGGNAANEGAVLVNDTWFENQQHYLLAQNRSGNGMHSTQRSACLDSAAREWAQIMARDVWLRHSSPINALPEKYCGGGWTMIGENVGRTGLQAVVSTENSIKASTAVFDAYMNSPGHRANILNRRFTHHGVGAYVTADGRQVFTAQVFWSGRALPK